MRSVKAFTRVGGESNRKALFSSSLNSAKRGLKSERRSDRLAGVKQVFFPCVLSLSYMELPGLGQDKHQLGWELRGLFCPNQDPKGADMSTRKFFTPFFSYYTRRGHQSHKAGQPRNVISTDRGIRIIRQNCTQLSQTAARNTTEKRRLPFLLISLHKFCPVWFLLQAVILIHIRLFFSCKGCGEDNGSSNLSSFFRQNLPLHSSFP